MSESLFTSRAAVRRTLALHADGAKLPIAAALADAAGAGPLPPAEAGEIFAAYALDPRASALLATTPERAAWLAGPLFRPIGPGNYVPVEDEIAALIAGPILAKSDAFIAHRWAPRADDAVAVALAALPLDERAPMLARLAADRGPDPDVLALSTVQCGRALAWSPELLDTPIGEQLVADLLALLQPARPRPLLDAVARALGPIAARPHRLGEFVHKAALLALDAADRPVPRSFAAEISAIGRARKLPDEDRLLALPAREVAQVAAYICGFASPLDRRAFAAHRALVLDRPDGGELVGAFADGLIAAGHAPALAELATGLLDDDALAGFGIAAALPLDSIADRLIAELDNERPSHRALACAAVELLEPGWAAVDDALARRLGDPSPEVAAAAARALVERGRIDLLTAHPARDDHPLRAAIARAATGDLSVPVIGELARSVVVEVGAEAGAEAEAAHAEPMVATPLVRLFGDCLLGSIEGLETAANLVGGVPEAAAILALAASADLDRDAGVLAPPDARAHFAAVALKLAADATPELAALALFVLARISAGDAGVVAELIAGALTRTVDQGAQLVAAIAELRVATPETAAALAPLVAADQPIGARVLAAVACGRALPADHAAWADVRALLELGTYARAAAWTALRDRARRA